MFEEEEEEEELVVEEEEEEELGEQADADGGTPSSTTPVIASPTAGEQTHRRQRQVMSSPTLTPVSSVVRTPPETRSRKRVVRSLSPAARTDDSGNSTQRNPQPPGVTNSVLICIDLTNLKKRIKKLKHERDELETTFRELQKRQQERLQTQAAELDRGNKELRAKIEALELNDSEDEID
jgi:hypothetical protein